MCWMRAGQTLRLRLWAHPEALRMDLPRSGRCQAEQACALSSDTCSEPLTVGRGPGLEAAMARAQP